MGLLREIRNYVHTAIRSYLAEYVETHLPCQVVSFDRATNLVNLQPCIERMRTLDPGNMTTVQMPPINDVPVQQFGSGDLLCQVDPKAGSYGNLHVSKRRIDSWLKLGGIVVPTSAVIFDPSWGFFSPGVYTLVVDGNNGKLQNPIMADRIGFRNRAATEELTLDTNGVVRLITDDDWAVQYTALKAAFDTMTTDLNALITSYNAHVHITTATVSTGLPGVLSPTVSTGTPTTADMASAKITDIRVP